ncbi:hypothetical protein V8G54_012418, partial [Vigna mungo]
LWCCRLHHVPWQEGRSRRCWIHFGNRTRRRRRRMRHRPCLRGRPRVQGCLRHGGRCQTILVRRGSEHRVVLENEVVTNVESEVKEMDLAQKRRKCYFGSKRLQKGKSDITP